LVFGCQISWTLAAGLEVEWVTGVDVVPASRFVARFASLTPEVAWLEHYRSGTHRLTGSPPARLLAPMARMLRPRQEDQDQPDQRPMTLSAGAMRSLLDTISSRLDESRELSRYMTGLLIFLGLLGTFWGLLKTIGSVAEVINAMTIGTGDVTVLFDHLKAGLAKPLAGMGTAFSASLFGLAGALILGFLDLTAGQAQNRFFNELEEWLAGLTRLSSGALADGEGSVPVYVQALLEQTAENMEGLQRVLTRDEENRAQVNQAVLTLNERLGTLADTMRAKSLGSSEAAWSGPSALRSSVRCFSMMVAPSATAASDISKSSV